jgi:homoserine O-acetyltransferase/O-succinyltransferase
MSGVPRPSNVPEPTVEADCTLESFTLESGVELKPAVLHYAVYGKLNEAKNNAVLVCHALSGSARVSDWWPELFGGEKIFDVERDCVICVNVPGSCYGSTGPTSTNPATGKPFGPDFPLVTIRDMVRAEAAVLDKLGISKLRVIIGGSIGGMQALEWAIQYPERVGTCIAIGAARLSAMGLALNHLQRRAIQLDPAFQGGQYAEGCGPEGGLALARGLAMCTYKSSELFDERYARKPNRSGEDPLATVEGRYDVAGYLDHQGKIFVKRFDANTYITISKAMDTFDFARGFASDSDALRRIKARVLMLGISTDWLFPPADVRRLAEEISAAGAQSEYVEQISDHGHDAFLAEPEHLLNLILPTLAASRIEDELVASSAAPSAGGKGAVPAARFERARL